MSRQKNRAQAMRPGGISRRDFARQAALAAAAAAVIPGAVVAEPGHSETTGTPWPQEAANQPPKLSPESQAEVKAKVEAIVHRYGSRLTEEQKKEVRRLVTEFQAPLEKLRSFPLENGDGPAMVFVPSGAPASTRAAAASGVRSVRGPKPPVREKKPS